VISAGGVSLSRNPLAPAAARRTRTRLLNVAMGMAFGALLHNTASAIVLYYLSGIVWGFLGSIGPIEKVAEWLDPIRVIGDIQAAEWTGRWPEIATALCVWIALPMVAGAARPIRRDVS